MASPHKIIFACDESGAKGYADQDEAFPGEVGVFAGILMPDEHSAQKTPPFQDLIRKYTPESGKLHIAELADDKKEALRTEVYEVISSSGLPCFWYAIHVSGIHRHFQETEEFREEARKKIQETNPHPRFKRGSHRSNPSLMHAELFNGLFAHLVAFLDERKLREVEIEIRSDQIDKSIIKIFEAAAIRLLTYGSKPSVTRSTAFDDITKKVVEGTIVIKADLPAELALNVAVRSLTFNPVAEGDGLVLAADVLANSLFHLFKNRPANELYKDLNRPNAVLGRVDGIAAMRF